MSTEAQVSVNQANAQLSTGPGTPEGKAASSRDNLRHGFRSQSMLLPGDDPAEYDALLAELTDTYQPEDLTDRRFLREMADAEWRLRRVRQYMESALTRRIAVITADHPGIDPVELQSLALESLAAGGGPSYGTWLRYETKFERQYERAYKGWANYQDFLRRVNTHQSRLEARNADTMMKAAIFAPVLNLASSVQTPATPPAVPRNAPCSCGSGEKYKRCCGKNAPPVLSPPRSVAA